MMNAKYLFLITGLALATTAAHAGDKTDYAVGNIPPELLKNANAVVRWDETRFEVTDLDRAREIHRFAITILNERGDDHAQFAEDYDKLHSIESVEGTVYDASGKKVKSLKKSDLGDYSGSGGSNLMVDDRIKTHNFYCKTYPYTVEYQVEIKYYYTMFFPRWVPMKGEHVAVQDSRIVVICPTDYKFRYKAFNYTREPVVTTEKSTTSYTWTLNNASAVEDEYASPTWSEMTPTVYLGPDQFALVREEEGLTVIGPDPAGEWARISLGVHSSLDAVGMTAALSTRLTEAGISANVVAAFYHDHFFVPWDRREEALACLRPA